MTLETRCPKCAQHYTLPESLAGKSVKCKKCGHAFKLTAQETPAAEETAASSVPETSPDAQHATPAHDGPQPAPMAEPAGLPNIAWIAIGVGGGLVLLLVLAVVAALLLRSPDPATAPPIAAETDNGASGTTGDDKQNGDTHDKAQSRNGDSATQANNKQASEELAKLKQELSSAKGKPDKATNDKRERLVALLLPTLSDDERNSIRREVTSFNKQTDALSEQHNLDRQTVRVLIDAVRAAHDRERLEPAVLKQLGDIQIDGKIDDWPADALVWEEAGDKPPMGIDVRRVMMGRRGDDLYLFIECDPPISELPAEQRARASHIASLFFDLDNKDTTGNWAEAAHSYGIARGYEKKLGLRITQGAQEKPVTYYLQSVNDKGLWDPAVSDENPRLAEGANGIEMAIPLNAVALQQGQVARVLLQEPANLFQYEGYSVRLIKP